MPKAPFGRSERFGVGDGLAPAKHASGARLLLNRGERLFAAGKGLRQESCYLGGPQVARDPPRRAILVHNAKVPLSGEREKPQPI
jgi:hypothetical protein